MRKIFALLILLFGLIQNAVAATPEEIAQAWKERGFVAISRLDSLTGKNDAKSKYQYLLEYAFAMHATTDESNKFGFVHKIENDLDFYKIILNKGKNPKSKTGVDEEGLFVINYIYDYKTGAFNGAKIELLPIGWYIHANPMLQNTLLLDVNDNNIVIVFDLSNPINTYVEFLQ